MTKAVFYGASTVEGTGASTPEKRFTSVLCQTLGWQEINLGIGGTTMTGRDDKGMIVDEESGIGRVPDILHAAPDIVVILYGANDFAQSRPLGDPSQFRQGTFYWDYDTVIRGLIENLQAIRQLSERYSLRLADVYANAGIDRRNFPALSADEAHLNDDGHQRLAAFFIECLQMDRCD
jgi:lysophospholipase L1-like esterase